MEEADAEEAEKAKLLVADKTELAALSADEASFEQSVQEGGVS